MAGCESTPGQSGVRLKGVCSPRRPTNTSVAALALLVKASIVPSDERDGKYSLPGSAVACRWFLSVGPREVAAPGTLRQAGRIARPATTTRAATATVAPI